MIRDVEYPFKVKSHLYDNQYQINDPYTNLVRITTRIRRCKYPKKRKRNHVGGPLKALKAPFVCGINTLN